MRRIRVTISLAALLMMLVISAYPTAMAAMDGVVVSTEGELLTAIAKQAALVVIDGEIPLSQEVIIEHHLTMRGQGALTVSDSHRHFEIREYGHLVLDGDIILTRALNYDGEGGSIFVAGGTFTFYSGEISGNRTHRGGGIFVAASMQLGIGSAHINGGVIRQNHAKLGGGIFVSGGFVDFDGGVIEQNHAEQGGGIYVDGGSVRLNGGVIRQNHADVGGGVYLGTILELFGIPRLSMRGSLIEENTAEIAGGGIFSQKGNLYLLNGTIQNNQAAGHGGVYISIESFKHIEPEMRIDGNTPINRHETPAIPWHEQLQTPTTIHLLALFAIAGIGMYIAKRKREKQGDGSCA